MLAEFDFLMPRSLPEALQMLAEHGPALAPLAGGTNVVVDLRSGRHCPAALLDLSQLAELHGIRREDGYIVIGARTTLSEVLSHPLIAEHGAALRDAAAVFANPLVRNRATVGGNIADASPAADTAPALLALDASVELVSAGGTRSLPLEQFFVGVRRTQRRHDELLSAIRWPVPPTHSAGGFSKLGLRQADAIAVLSVAVVVEGDASGNCRQARIALGAVAPRPVRSHPAEEVLQDQPLTADTIALAARLAAETASPISDIRASADYRRRVVAVLVRRLLTQLSEKLASAAQAGLPAASLRVMKRN
jgi:CO/xanthine dehydrogenase FAD-binding subunit